MDTKLLLSVPKVLMMKWCERMAEKINPVYVEE